MKVYDDTETISLQDDNERHAACSFLTGSAGCGKTYTIAQRIIADPNYALLAATTGISAINLGENVTTVNSALGYYDTESLLDNYINGRVLAKLNKLAKLGYKNLVIDEVSMMPAEQLEIITRAADDLANYSSMADREPMGIVLTGDACQLPPIKAKWFFESSVWPRYAENMTRLTKCWRQSNLDFQSALAAFRKGDGQTGVDLLDSCGVRYADNNLLDYPGTTIVSKNDEVDRFNWACHQKVHGPITRSISTRWGKQKPEWKLIPEFLQVKIGAYVMLLTNQKSLPLYSDEWFERDEETGERLSRDAGFEFVNGDCGMVVDLDPSSGVYQVRLKRDDRIVRVSQITRRNEQKEKPDDLSSFDEGEMDNVPYYDSERKRWVVGVVTYMPMRLAYASTVHKSQGLSLDSVQVNLSNPFFSQPAMVYVSLSRCRDALGLRIVGTKDLLVKRTRTDPKVRAFL